MNLSRRLLLSASVLAALVACAEEAPPPSYPPPSYDYLTTIKLNVGRIEIDDSWAPRGVARRVEYLSPIQPREALRRMAEDRLIAGGTTGRAAFIIEDASIVRGPRNYEASLAVRVDIADDAGNRLGQASARVVQQRPIRGESERAVRDDLYAFVRDLMNEMNVEFEYQLRRSLREAMQQTDSAAPAPAPVEAQPLDTPGAAPASPAPAPAPAPAQAPAPERPDAPVTMSPPPGNLGTMPLPRVQTPTPLMLR